MGLSIGLAGAVTTASSAHAASSVPAFDHIFTIVMENHSYGEIIGNVQAPYINSLANQYGLATQYFAVAHPSLPNYLALTGGTTFGVTTDCTNCFQNAPNIAVDRVETSGRSWKAYMESMPSPCFVGNSGEYVQKHDPFIYYDDIRLNSTECNKVVPYTQLASDLTTASSTPNYVWITPNLINDMHDGTIAQGDSWLSSEVPKILNSPAWTAQNSLLQIVWDEDDGSQSNQIPALVISKNVAAGFRSGIHYDHYSALKTVENAWGLAPLTSNDTSANAMGDFFGTSTVTLPGAPTGVSATGGRHDSATVTWTPPTDNGGCTISGYTVTSSPGGLTKQVAGSSTSATFSRLTDGTTYTFTATATNCVGTGPTSNPSNPITATKH